jgi:predicted RNA-binding protein YlqC (UPF0109 family)
MKKLLEYLVTSIVSYPDEVKIQENQEGDFVNLSLKTHPDDIKIIIGRQGRTIRAIRNLIRTKAAKQGKKVNLIIEEKP